MNQVMTLIFTFGVGLFILLGTVIVFVTKNNEKFVQFSISMAFGVMVTLIIFELLPESMELMQESVTFPFSFLYTILFIVLGIGILKVLDLFIPDHSHEHEHETKSEHKHHLFHIGLVSSIALLIHNIIEGMSIYGTTIRSVTLGMLVSLGVGLHNIPMGMVIASTFYKANNNRKRTILISFLLAISTFIGGVLLYFLSGDGIPPFYLGMMLLITVGMLIYIVFFELLPLIRDSKDHKTTISGMIVGIVVLGLSLCIHG